MLCTLTLNQIITLKLMCLISFNTLPHCCNLLSMDCAHYFHQVHFALILCVCLQNNLKSYERILIKFLGNDPDHYLDTGIFTRIFCQCTHVQYLRCWAFGGGMRPQSDLYNMC